MSVFNNLFKLDNTQPKIPSANMLPTNQLKPEQSKAASIGGRLAPTGKASSSAIPTRRPPADLPTSQPTLPTAHVLKNGNARHHVNYSFPKKEEFSAHASAQLNGPEKSAGSQKLFEAMKRDPGQLEVDINRCGDLKLGDTTFPRETYGEKSSPVIYRWISSNITEYIRSENPSLKVDKSKMNEILYSTVQTFSNELNRDASEAGILPSQGEWGSRASDTKQTTSFEFEKNFLGLTDPTILVVSKRIEKNYVNFDDPSQPNKVVIMEAKVKHDLKTGLITFDNVVTVDGKQHKF